MAKQESPMSRTTVYRLRKLEDLTSAIRRQYVDEYGFTETSTTIEGRKALLVTGSMRKQRVAWTERLSTIVGEVVDEGNVTAAAVLIISDEDNGDTAFAMTYGMGYQLLDRAKIDPGFGMRIAARTISPEEIRSITRTELDYRSKTDRSSIPAGDVLRGFGISDYGEIITRLSARARLPSLKVGDKPITVRAADSLSVPIGSTAQTLVSDLDAIAEALKSDAKPELRDLEQFVPVKNPELIKDLDSQLNSALTAANPKRLALGWPHEKLDDNGTPSSHKMSGTGKRKVMPVDDLPELDEIVKTLRSKNEKNPLDAAKSIKIQLFRDADGEDRISAPIPAKHWLMFEVNQDDKRYCHMDSRWYAMDTDYARRLQRHVEQIFERPAVVKMPDWNVDTYRDESKYNQMAAQQLQGIMLDREPIQTTQHPRGFEACDIIAPKGVFIHVKHIPKSSAASHLVAQATVATDALRYDEEARKSLQKRIDAAGGGKESYETFPKSVVLGMARNKAVTPNDLFSFSQVIIAKLDASLSGAGITLTIAPIRRMQ